MIGNTTTAIHDWGTATWAGLTAGLASFYSFVPHLIGAIVVLLIGWGIAWLLSTLTDKLLDAVHFDRWIARTGLDEAMERSNVRIDPSNVIAQLVKWSVLLVTFMVAAEQLGLTSVSMGIAAILSYLPNVIAAVLILALGLFLARFVASLVRTGATQMHLKATELFADLSFWIVVLFAAMGALSQLNIAPALVQTIYTAAVAAIALALALAFGFGLRDQARALVAGQAVSEQVHAGDEIWLDEGQGRVVKVGLVTTLIDTGDGKLLSVPNQMLTDMTFRMRGPRPATVGGGGGPLPVKHTVETEDVLQPEETFKPSDVDPLA